MPLRLIVARGAVGALCVNELLAWYRHIMILTSARVVALCASTAVCVNVFLTDNIRKDVVDDRVTHGAPRTQIVANMCFVRTLDTLCTGVRLRVVDWVYVRISGITQAVGDARRIRARH